VNDEHGTTAEVTITDQRVVNKIRKHIEAQRGPKLITTPYPAFSLHEGGIVTNPLYDVITNPYRAK